MSYSLLHPRLRARLPFFSVLSSMVFLAGCGSSPTPLKIETQPANETVQAGQSATFQVVASGDGTLRYQWTAGGVPISGATGSAYTVPQASVAQSGISFSVAVTEGGETASSTPAILTVTPLASTLSFAPVSTVTYGAAPFTVSAQSASSAPVGYKVTSGPAAVSGNTVSITGAGTVVLEADQPAAGNFAAATATTSFNVAPATPALSFAPITAQTYGNSAFSVSATSASSGAVTYAVASGPATLAGNTVTITGAGNVVLSATQVANGNYGSAHTTVSVPVAPETPSLSFVTAANQTYGTPAFPVSATSASNGAVTYSVTSGPATISGNTVTLTGLGTVVLSATQAANGNYGTATASTSFKVGANIAVSAISPANQTMAPGQQTFTATATGGATDALSWSASAGTISSAGVWTSPNTVGSYTITATSTEDPTKAVSTTTTVSAPLITAQPVSRAVCPGSPVTLSTTAQYAASYQWYLNGAQISGATSASYTIPTAISSNTGAYNVVVSNPAGNANSTVASLAVGSMLTTNPQGASLLQPAKATFSVAAQGQSPFTYQWFSVAPGATTGAALQGATAASYTTPVTTLASNGEGFYADVTDSCGTTLTSSTATLAVNSGPIITQQPANQPLSPGNAANLSVTATGSPSLSYQWFYVPAAMKNGIAIADATGPTYIVPPSATTSSNSGDAYFVTISNAFGSVTSQSAMLQASSSTTSQWVVGWGASPENALPGSENPGGQEQSFRFFFYPTVPGSVERVHLSNLFGTTPITVGAARIAPASSNNGVNGNAIDTAQDFPLSFQGSTSITLQPGQEVVSDPVQISYTLGQKLAMTMYVQGTFPALTQHESQVNVNYATPNGAGNTTTDASGASFTNSNTEWYLLTGVDVYGAYQGTVAVFGSSSIDGHASNYGSSNAYPVSNVPVPGQDNDRPSDWLGRQLASAGYNLGVLNAGTIGDPAGEDARTAAGSVIAGVDRMQHDVLAQPGIKAVVIYFGGIDIRGDCVPSTNVEASLTSMVSQANAAGVRVILATLPPSEYCLSTAPLPSAAAPFDGDLYPGPENPGSTQRRLLNDWIRTTGATLPGVVAIADFDAALLDPAHPDFMQPNLNSGDNFHPNGVGYGVQSSAIPLSSLLGP